MLIFLKFELIFIIMFYHFSYLVSLFPNLADFYVFIIYVTIPLIWYPTTYCLKIFNFFFSYPWMLFSTILKCDHLEPKRHLLTIFRLSWMYSFWVIRVGYRQMFRIVWNAKIYKKNWNRRTLFFLDFKTIAKTLDTIVK